MRLAGAQGTTDALDERRAMDRHEAILALLRIERRIEVLELLGRHERYVSFEAGLKLWIVPFQLVERSADGGDDAIHHVVQVCLVALVRFDDLLPVPLVHIDGVEVVQLLVAANGVHVAHDALAHVEVVALERIALPFRQRLHDLGIRRDGGNVESDGSLHAVQVVVESRGGVNDQRCRHPYEVERRAELGDKHVLDAFDGALRVVQRKLRFVVFGNADHGISLSSFQYGNTIPPQVEKPPARSRIDPALQRNGNSLQRCDRFDKSRDSTISRLACAQGARWAMVRVTHGLKGKGRASNRFPALESRVMIIAWGHEGRRQRSVNGGVSVREGSRQ